MESAASIIGANAVVAAVNDGGNANVVIRASEAGRRWAIFYLYLEAAANTTLLFKSGSTALSGAIQVAAASAGTPAPLILDGRGSPILVTTAVGDTFNVDNSASTALDGFVLMMGMESQ